MRRASTLHIHEGGGSPVALDYRSAARRAKRDERCPTFDGDLARYRGEIGDCRPVAVQTELGQKMSMASIQRRKQAELDARLKDPNDGLTKNMNAFREEQQAQAKAASDKAVSDKAVSDKAAVEKAREKKAAEPTAADIAHSPW